jgi:hypothetical protein
MGIIKEPLDIDFEVDPRTLTEVEKKSISDFIKADKELRKKKELRKRTTLSNKNSKKPV